MDQNQSAGANEHKTVHCVTEIEGVAAHSVKASAQRDYVHLDNPALLLEPTGGDLSLLAPIASGEKSGQEAEIRDINVQRRVLTQKAFDELHEPSPKTPLSPKRIFQAIGRRVDCSASKVKRRAYKMVPFVEAMRNYDAKNWLLVDVICGITIGIITIPQGMGYALLASVQPVYGLYSSFLPVLLYCIFGSSRHMCYGTLAITYLLVGNAVSRATAAIMSSSPVATSTSTSTTGPAIVTASIHAPATSVSDIPWGSSSVPSLTTTTEDPNSSLQAAINADVAICLTFLMGIVQLAIGFFRLGFVTIYFADSMVAGYTTATICYVFTSQLSSLFGISFPRQTGYLNLIKTWVMVFSNIAHTNVATLIVSISSIFVLSIFKFWINPKVMKKIRAPIPVELLVIIGAIVASTYLDLHGLYKVAIVGKVPVGLPTPTIPDLSLTSYVIGDAIIISFVTFGVSVSLAQVLAKKHGYEIDDNQEAVAYGISHLIPSFFHAIPSGGSVARSCVTESIQAKSQLVSMISSVMVLVVLYTVAEYFEQLPIAALASIIVVGLSGMIDQFKNVGDLWKISKFDAIIWLVSFAGTVLCDTDIGLVIAILFSFFIVVVRTQATKRGLLGNVTDTDLYEDIKKYKDAQETQHVKIYRFAGAINFACATIFRSSLYKKTGVNPRKVMAERNKLERKKKQVEKRMSNAVDQEKFDRYKDITDRQKVTSPVKFIVIELSACSYIDFGGLRIVKQIIQEYNSIGITVFIAGCTANVRSTLRKTDFYSVNDASIVFVSVHDAVTAAKILLAKSLTAVVHDESVNGNRAHVTTINEDSTNENTAESTINSSNNEVN